MVRIKCTYNIIRIYGKINATYNGFNPIYPIYQVFFTRENSFERNQYWLRHRLWIVESFDMSFLKVVIKYLY